MVESKFAFFEMQKEVFAANATALRQTRFRRTPEALNAIDVDAAAPHKDTVAMFDAEMFPIAEVHQPVVADPAIGMNDAGQGDATANNAPQGGLFRVGDDLGIDAALAFEDAKHDRFAPGAAAALAANAAAAEIRFVDFDRAAHRRMLLADPGHANTEGVKEPVHGAATDVGELRDFGGLEIEREEAYDLPKFGLRNM